jgi:hypothetical protein
MMGNYALDVPRHSASLGERDRSALWLKGTRCQNHVPLVRAAGFEPTTFRPSTGRSTAELRQFRCRGVFGRRRAKPRDSAVHRLWVGGGGVNRREALESIARAIYEELEHMDPSDDRTWPALSARERGLYRNVARNLLARRSLLLTALDPRSDDDLITGGSEHGK